MDELRGKSQAIFSIFSRLCEELGPRLSLVDHWEADLNAIGVAKAENHQILAYIAVYGERFYVELELPSEDDSDFPYQLAGTFDNVTEVRVIELVKSHLSRESASMKIVNRDKTTPFITADGSQIRELMHPNFSGAQNQSLAEATLPPGGATTEHYHPRTEEIYYVLQGTARLRVGQEIRDLAPSDAALIPTGARHKIWNSGNDNLVFLCCCAPAYSHDDTILTE